MVNESNPADIAVRDQIEEASREAHDGLEFFPEGTIRHESYPTSGIVDSRITRAFYNFAREPQRAGCHDHHFGVGAVVRYAFVADPGLYYCGDCYLFRLQRLLEGERDICSFCRYLSEPEGMRPITATIKVYKIFGQACPDCVDHHRRAVVELRRERVSAGGR